MNADAIRHRLRIDRRLIWLLAWLGLAGCGADDWATVRGRVRLDGKPVSDALIEFQPTSPDGSPASALTDSEGRYDLRYSFQRRGTAPGEYTVSIRTGGTFVDDEGREVECRECIPARYNTRTELRRTVRVGGNTLDFDL